MGNKKVPGAKLSFTIALYLVGNSLVLGSGNDAKQDSWLAALIATGTALLLAWLYAAVLRLHPGKNMFDIFVEVLGGFWGKLLCGIYVFYAVFLGAQVFRIFDEFIQLVNLDRTPQVAILLFSVPLIVWQVRSGLKNLASCGKFLLPFVLIFVAATFLLGTHFMKLENIRPILGSGMGALTGGSLSMLTLPLGEVVLCMSFFGEADPEESPFRVLAVGILMGGGTICVITLRNLLLLGAPTCRMFLFASYDAVGVVSVGDFVTRISVLVGINLVLAGVIKISTCLYAASSGISKILGLRSFLQPAAPCCLLMAAVGCTLFDDVVTGLSFIRWIPLLSVPFQLLLPLLVLIVGMVKKHVKSAKKPGAAQSTPG